jgi:hypothetical protein
MSQCYIFAKEESVMGRLAQSNVKTNKMPKNAENMQDWNEELHELIAERAYYKAEARGYAPGHEIQDWVDAEAEIEAELYS